MVADNIDHPTPGPNSFTAHTKDGPLMMQIGLEFAKVFKSPEQSCRALRVIIHALPLYKNPAGSSKKQAWSG
jgi:hypothetical protein